MRLARGRVETGTTLAMKILLKIDEVGLSK
jgi:hypothetical protein